MADLHYASKNGDNQDTQQVDDDAKEEQSHHSSASDEIYPYKYAVNKMTSFYGIEKDINTADGLDPKNGGEPQDENQILHENEKLKKENSEDLFQPTQIQEIPTEQHPPPIQQTNIFPLPTTVPSRHRLRTYSHVINASSVINDGKPKKWIKILLFVCIILLLYCVIGVTYLLFSNTISTCQCSSTTISANYEAVTLLPSRIPSISPTPEPTTSPSSRIPSLSPITEPTKSPTNTPSNSKFIIPYTH